MNSGSVSRGPRLQIDSGGVGQEKFVNIGFGSPSPVYDKPQTLPTSAVSPYSQKPNSRALNESRKLLAHLLEQLQNRPMPPSVFDAFQTSIDSSAGKGFGAIVQTVRSVVKFKGARQETRGQSTVTGEVDDEDEEMEYTFTTNVTFDLLLQLREMLIVSVAQGWRIFHDGSSPVGNENHFESVGRLSSAFRLSRHGFQPVGRRPRSHSPVPGKRSRSPSPVPGGRMRAPELLARCISILESIVSEDCRFRISSPRPSRPPNALQALALDVAQFLLHTNRNDPKIISQIGFALIPAFSTFHAEMRSRLLTFFEQSIIRGVLEDLRQIQGADGPILSPTQKKGLHKTNDIESIQQPVVSIQIEAAPEDDAMNSTTDLSWRPWLSSSSSEVRNLLSANAPRQPISVYYLASLTTPLLAAMLETIELVPDSDTRIETLHRFYQLLNTIVNYKVDAYLNLLEVVAYHTSKARHAAISLLTTFWPKSLGHVIISKPLAISSYRHSAAIVTKFQWLNDHPYAHQLVPWHFSAQSVPHEFDVMSLQDCRSCSTSIHGFGLLCVLCMSAVHFDCYDYPEGCHMFQYTMANDPNMQKIAMHRYCYVLPARRDSEPKVVSYRGHSFRLVNLFSLSLCFICRNPLWGCTAQAYKCSSCRHLAHPSCLSNKPAAELPPCDSNNFDASHVSVEWSALRSSFVSYYRDSSSSEELGNRTYEEVSVYYSVFWTQLQLLVNGLALGSIVIKPKGRGRGHHENNVKEFELHSLVRLFETQLSSGRLSVSPAMDEYLQENLLTASKHSIMFDWSSLVYISTVIKSPFNAEKTSDNTSTDLLNVTQPDIKVEPTTDTNSHSFDVVSLFHLRDALGYQFHVHSDAAARLLLSHLHHLGFFDRLDLELMLFQGEAPHEQISCNFPLPLGLDMSTDVETLVSAVEGCLSDLDLSVNEVGFLLLVRKLYPNGMVSEYALRRLSRSLLSWIISEDDSLATILRDFVARQRILPGVRSGVDEVPWPSTRDVRPTPSGSVNNGGDYVAARRTLLHRYGTRWLLALHDRDPTLYVKILYDFCTETAQKDTGGEFFGMESKDGAAKIQSEYLDNILRVIAKLVQSCIYFSIFDELFLRWLDSVPNLNTFSFREPLPSLLRLFPEEKSRFSTSYDQTLSSEVTKAGLTADPWRLVMGLASKSKEGLSRSLQWLCIFACSGVDIPVSVFVQFSSLVNVFNASLVDSLLLVEATFSSTWLKSLGRQDLQTVLSTLHSRLASHILHCLQTKNELRPVVRFIRQTLSTCLLLYGCERKTLLLAGMITEDDTKHLPSRRKLNTRGPMLSDPIIIDVQLMSVLERYINANIEDVTCLIAKFLNMFVNDSPYLESHEVDNFILRNEMALCTCAWHFYDIQRPDISSIRTSFLLRILVVDAQAFQALLQDCFRAGLEWESRFITVTRLFRIILDVTSPAFNVEDRQWRSSVIDVFYYYFNAAWADEKEEIRIAVDSWSKTLLPAHFEAITLCWNESLAKAPITERVKLVSFLIQLHPHFPSWKVLSWDGIIETLLQDDYEQKNGDDENGPAATHLSLYGLSSSDRAERRLNTDPDMALLRVSIILLSLQMIADGIAIDVFSLLKIKLYLVQIIGCHDASVAPTPNGHTFHVRFTAVEKIPDLSLPCVNELVRVLDAQHPFYLAPSAVGGPYTDDDDPWPLLIGSIFVDVSLVMFYTVEDMFSLPVLTMKSMLESLIIIIHKHDLESRPLKHLQSHFRKALRRTLDLLLQDVGYEIRQLALSVIQACTKRWSALMGNLLYDAVDCIAKLIVLQNHHDQDILVVQGRSYIESTITMFSGFFNALCKRPLDSNFFLVLKHIANANAKTVPHSSESLRDALLRDTLARAAENHFDTFQPVLKNLQTYVEVVHYQGFSTDLMQFVGFCLTMLVRRTSEWSTEDFDPSPLLLIPAILIQHNKAQCRELLMYTETVLRALLLRFHVNTTSLLRLLHATSSLSRKTQSQNQLQSNNIASSVYEILMDGLRTKVRVLPSTLTSILEAITMPEKTGSIILPQIFLESSLADNGVLFLQSHVWSDIHSEDDFYASLAVAKFVLEAVNRDQSLTNLFLWYDQGAEKVSRQNLNVRTWNVLALAALSDSSSKWVPILFPQLPTFSFAFSSSLRLPSHSSTGSLEFATIDINHAYIAIKLWILLARKKSHYEEHSPDAMVVTPGTQDDGDAAEITVWNNLWPAFEGLMNSFDVEGQTGNLSTLTTLTCSSVANLFLFLRQLCSPLALEISTKSTILTRLRDLGRGEEAATSKLSRALRVISEPPGDMSFENLVSQAAKEIVAAEKLQALEVKGRDIGKAVAERHRRDVRVPT